MQRAGMARINFARGSEALYGHVGTGGQLFSARQRQSGHTVYFSGDSPEISCGPPEARHLRLVVKLDLHQRSIQISGYSAD